jgi:hypothetical protein
MLLSCPVLLTHLLCRYGVGRQRGSAQTAASAPRLMWMSVRRGRSGQFADEVSRDGRGVGLSAGSPGAAGVEVGNHRGLPVGGDEPQLGQGGEAHGDHGGPGVVGTAEEGGAGRQVPAVAGDQLDVEALRASVRQVHGDP